MTSRVLVVEDEPHIRELVCLHLGHEGYACQAVADGAKALKLTESERFDLLVLDVMIPGLDGLSLCRAVRNGQLNRDVPILMLTARRDESDKVVGLESGADDYLTKPFGVRELGRAGTRAAAASATGGAPAGADGAQAAAAGHRPAFTKSRSTCRNAACAVGGRDIELTDQEFRLLHLLATHAGIVFSRERCSPRSGAATPS
jgi:DNA-binding response OmpR family regulator